MNRRILRGDREFICKVIELNPIRPNPPNNPVCFKFLAEIRKNNPEISSVTR